MSKTSFIYRKVYNNTIWHINVIEESFLSAIFCKTRIINSAGLEKRGKQKMPDMPKYCRFYKTSCRMQTCKYFRGFSSASATSIKHIEFVREGVKKTPFYGHTRKPPPPPLLYGDIEKSKCFFGGGGGG